jgi:hypothetical protein
MGTSSMRGTALLGKYAAPPPSAIVFVPENRSLRVPKVAFLGALRPREPAGLREIPTR